MVSILGEVPYLHTEDYFFGLGQEEKQKSLKSRSNMIFRN